MAQALPAVLQQLLDSDSEDEDDLDTSSSEDETDILLIQRIVDGGDSSGSGARERIPRIKLYVETVVATFSSAVFKSHFRMYRETFEFVLGLIGAKLTRKREHGRSTIEPKKQLLIALWMMATPDSYRSVCEKFDVGKATALRAVRRVSYALHCLAPRFIKWPRGSRAVEVMTEFEQNSAFPRVIGAIDGTHIHIHKPKEDGTSYVNRKGVYSVQVQAVCTRDLLFTSVYAGNVGSIHDSRVFRLSPVQEYVENPETYFAGDSHLVGDAAYGIHSCLMVPFKDNGHLTDRQKNFNFCLSSARMCIERAFGVWKMRWRSIKDCLPMVRIDKIPEYLLALAVLHNICILRGDLVDFNTPEVRIRNRGRLVAGGRDQGNLKREQIMNNLIIRNN